MIAVDALLHFVPLCCKEIYMYSKIVSLHINVFHRTNIQASDTSTGHMTPTLQILVLLSSFNLFPVRLFSFSNEYSYPWLCLKICLVPVL